MKYQIFGQSVPYVGKTIWEIAGNLKNLGVGRLIVADENLNKFVEPTFYKIVKVLPFEDQQKLGYHRKVIFHAEYVLKGKKIKEIEVLKSETVQTKYHLIPKAEEFKYINGITDTPKMTTLPKYQEWPPLFKILWEEKQKKEGIANPELEKLNTIIDHGEKSFEKLAETDEIETSFHSSLYLTEKPVEELYKEIHLLRLKLNKQIPAAEEN